MNRHWIAPFAALFLAAGCTDQHDTIVAPIDTHAPAPPRGLVSVTGDGEVFLSWLPNTEPDVAGYRVYESACAGGPSCPYSFVSATTGTELTVSGLADGVKRYFAVSAYDHAGNESQFSDNEYVNDTPRPEGFGLTLGDAAGAPATAGYDFSAYSVRPWDDSRTDVYFSVTASGRRMIAPFVDTDIQDAGYASTLDAVDFAPSSGWSPTGAVELIAGHCYVVRIQSAPSVWNYGKFRVVSVGDTAVTIDWAYQVDPNNGELKVTRARAETVRTKRPVS